MDVSLSLSIHLPTRSSPHYGPCGSNVGCKRYNDTINFLSNLVTLRVADPAFLITLLRPETYRPNNIATNIFQNVHKLHITARLSLPACKIMEGERDLEADSNEAMAGAELWNSIWPLIAQLSTLRVLTVEIDHTAAVSWSVVHERAIASPIVTLATAAPQLMVAIVLPILHPFFENPTRHFMEGSDTSDTPGDTCKLTIQRRLRQEYHPTGKTGFLDTLIIRSCYNNYYMTPRLRRLTGLGELSQKELAWEEEDLARWRNGEDLHLEGLFNDVECAGCGGRNPEGRPSDICYV